MKSFLIISAILKRIRICSGHLLMCANAAPRGSGRAGIIKSTVERGLLMGASLLFLSACCTARVDHQIGLPDCDELIPVTPEIWIDIDKLRRTMSHNQLADLECKEKYRKRIELHDDNSG